MLRLWSLPLSLPLSLQAVVRHAQTIRFAHHMPQHFS
jgi:hypothetical protein